MIARQLTRGRQSEMSNTLTTETELTGRLSGQTVVIIGGSSGMGLETAREARAAGAALVLTGRDRDRLERAGQGVGALRTAELDLSEPGGLESFFARLPTPI